MNAVNESAKTTFFHILNYLESQNFPQDVLQPLALHLNRNLNFCELNSDGNLIQTQMDEAFFQWKKKNHPQILNEIIEKNDFSKRKEKNRNRLWSKPKKIKEDVFANFQLMKSVLGHRSFTDENEFTHSSVFNLLYDKTGTKLITADEDGLIKIWGSDDGSLKLTLKSHKAMINSIDISPCNKYLASCANDGCIRVWDLESGKPVTVFRQILGEKLLILFFIQWMDSKNENILVLVCASEEGNIYILDARDWALQPYYPKFTKLSSNHLFTSETGIMIPKKICCIDYHDNGYLSVGTLSGDIIIFDTLKNWTNFGGHHNILKSCVWNEHKKSCHLTVWAKDGSKLISASFDGTAKIWKWNPLSFSANIQKRSDYTIFFDSSKTHDAKCWSVNFSCKGRYAMASFSKKSRKKNETGQLMTNLQIFDCKLEKIIHTLDSKTTPIEMNQFIYIIEPHPTLDHIVFSADYIGQIALWDISKGQVLNYFQEKGFYFNYPDLSLPCLDGRFSPDGYSLAVSTFYGSFSLYGYGNRENYDYTPNEQFFESDFKKFEIDILGRVIDSETGTETDQGSGGICNHLKNVYPIQLKTKEDLNDGPVEEKYERLLFYYKMNEYLRNLMQKYLDESEQTRLLILTRQKKNLALPSMPSGIEAQPLSAAALHQIPRQITNLSALNAPSESSDLSVSNLRNNRNRRLKRLIRRNQNNNNNHPERGNDGEETKSNELNDEANDTNLRESRRTTNNNNGYNYGNNRISRYNTNNPRNNPIFSDKDDNLNGEQDDEEDESWQEDFSVSECQIKNLRNGRRRNKIQTRSSHFEQRPIKKVRLSEDDSDNGSPLLSNPRRHNLRQKRINYFHESDDEDDFIDNSPIPAKRKKDKKEDNFVKKSFAEREKEKEKERIPSVENENEKEKEIEKNENNLKRTSHFNAIEKEYEPRKKFKINNENAFELGSSVEGLCDRCKFHNAKSKCSGISCSMKFCPNCHPYRLILKNEKNFCIECYIKISKSKNTSLREFNREWLNYDDQSEDNYIPQIGDSVYYLFQAYEEFIANNFEILPFSEFSPSIYPFLDDNRLIYPVLCEIKDICFRFSLPKSKNSKTDTILALITLQYDQFNFKVGYNNINGKGFLVSKEIFECSRDVGKILKETMVVNYLKEGEIKNAQIIEISAKEDVFPNSPYNTIKILGFEEDGYNFRSQSRNNQSNVSSNKTSERISFWDIKSYGMPNNTKKIDYKSLIPQIPKERSNEIIDFIKKYITKNSGHTTEFVDAVDNETYPDYLSLIAFPMHLNRIIARLENGYYRRESSLKFDISFIEVNAEIYNESPSCIITYAKKICDDLKDFIDGKLRRTRGRIRNDERKDEYYEFFRLDSRNRIKEEKNDEEKRQTRSIRNKFN